MEKQTIKSSQNRMNAERYAAFRNRLYIVQTHGIGAVPRYFTAANQRIKQHKVQPK